MRLREQFELYSDGLFALPFAIPGTPYGKACHARKVISTDIEREFPVRHIACTIKPIMLLCPLSRPSGTYMAIIAPL